MIALKPKKILILDYSVDRKETALVKKWLPDNAEVSSYFIDTENSFPDDLITMGYTHIIHTGSALSINQEAPFTKKTVEYIQKSREIDVAQMGICYGHQLICRSLIGINAVRSSPHGFEAGWEQVSFSPEAIKLFNINESERVWQHHFDEVTQLPEGSILLATNPHTEIQAYMNTKHRLLGTQFHPEFDKLDGDQYYIHDRAFIEKNNYHVDEIVRFGPTFNVGKTFFDYFLNNI